MNFNSSNLCISSRVASRMGEHAISCLVCKREWVGNQECFHIGFWDQSWSVFATVFPTHHSHYYNQKSAITIQSFRQYHLHILNIFLSNKYITQSSTYFLIKSLLYHVIFGSLFLYHEFPTTKLFRLHKSSSLFPSSFLPPQPSPPNTSSFLSHPTCALKSSITTPILLSISFFFYCTAHLLGAQTSTLLPCSDLL